MEKNPLSGLTKDVLELRKNPAERRGLICRIARMVYSYPRNHSGWDEDDAGDFFCMFFPKIEGLIDNFEFRGRPFEAYLTSSVKWQMKTFARQRSVMHAQQEMIRTEYKVKYKTDLRSSAQLDIDESGPVYSSAVTKALGIGPDGVISDPAMGRRFAILVLRNVVLVDDSLIEHAARLSGIEPDILLGCATELRQAIAKRKARCLKMTGRRDCLYSRIRQLSLLCDRETDPERIRTYRRQIGFARKRYEKIIEQLNAVSLLPTHKEIGEALGVPKGSIDSSLYYIRKDLKNLELN
jgi:hypothetical protein